MPLFQLLIFTGLFWWPSLNVCLCCELVLVLFWLLSQSQFQSALKRGVSSTPIVPFMLASVHQTPLRRLGCRLQPSVSIEVYSMADCLNRLSVQRLGQYIAQNRPVENRQKTPSENPQKHPKKTHLIISDFETDQKRCTESRCPQKNLTLSVQNRSYRKTEN